LRLQTLDGLNCLDPVTGFTDNFDPRKVIQQPPQPQARGLFIIGQK
jgi:hypothetical protein